ncbi:MAG: DUF4397 domain-containing protein [Myxococcales bacterium]|nr:MAG: DUF4397 domain-containing protein [Myxococcales bacterium]
MNNLMNWVGMGMMSLMTVLLLAACDDEDSDQNGASAAQLRVIHLSADAPAVDVFVDMDATPVVSNLAFGSGTEYLSLNAGSYDIDVSAAGSTAADSVLAVDGLTLMAGSAYTAVAFNELASLQALALKDDIATSSAGNISVRAIHTAVGVGEVDIWNIPDTGDPEPLYENVGFGIAGDYLDLPAGAYTLGIDVDDDANPDLVFELPDLAGGSIANVFAVNDGTDVYLLAQLQDSTVARIDAN